MHPSQAADHTLILRWVRQHDAESFAQLVQRHATMVLAVCQRIVRDDGLAEELCQDCFLTLARHEAPPTKNVAGWLHRVATRRALSARRARPTPPAVEDPSQVEAPHDSHPTWPALETHIDAALAQIHESQREVVVGHFLEGQTHRQLAKRLGIGHRTVGYRIERGIEAVRDALRRRGVEMDKSTLAPALLALPSSHVSTTLAESLGKLAIAGPVPGTAGALATTGAVAGAVISKPGLTILGSLAAVSLALLAWQRPWTEPVEAHAESVPDPAVAAGQDDSDRTTTQTDHAQQATQESSEREAVRTAAAQGDPSTLSNEIRGVVRLADGQPLAGAAVLTFETEERPPEQYLHPITFADGAFHSVTTGADGSFALPKPEPGRVVSVCAACAGYFGTLATVRSSTDHAEPLVLVLDHGKSLRGTLRRPSGQPISGAAVLLAQAWTNQKWGYGSAIARTNPDGSFLLGTEAGTTGCTLIVRTEDGEQDIFIGVKPDADANLYWQERSIFRGQIEGIPDEDKDHIRVVVRGEIPDPPVAVFRSGIRPTVDFIGIVATDGSYTLDAQPGLIYRATVVRTKPDWVRPNRFSLPGERLTPETPVRFAPSPGEVTVRSFSLGGAIHLRGRVLTAKSRKPVHNAQVEFEKDGTALWDAFSHADRNGEFEVRLVAGSGTYTMKPSGPSSFLASTSHAITRDLAVGDSAEITFLLPEPVVIPFRVLDADGEPVESVRYSVSVKPAEGARTSLSSSCKLDSEGRGTIRVFAPVRDVALEVHRFPHGPKVSSEIGTPRPGHQARHTVLRLPPASDVVGHLTHPPQANIALSLVATYADGTKGRATANVLKDGAFCAKQAFRREPLALELSLGEHKTSVRASPSADGVIDLGSVSFD